MIVYGDPSFRVTAHSLLDEIKHLAACATQHDPDSCRVLLIKAGQLEQGLADAELLFHSSLLSVSETITDAAARQFIHSYGREPAFDSTIQPLCNDLARTLPYDLLLTIKVPEGFAFYTLFPEQYVISSREWLARRGKTRPDHVAVIGVRTIGTTLSAIVAETMRAEGCRATRLTVRPRGHPFERSVDLPVSAVRGCSAGLVVDEGPGLSGSSMAAVAKALCEHGFSHSQITFLPAHASEPGHAASKSARRWWSRVERVVAPLPMVRWKGETLSQCLQTRTRSRFGCNVRTLHDVSGGSWRRFAYANRAEWPTANIPLERTKFLCELEDGRRIIWKFTGLDGSICRPAVDGSITSIPQCDYFRGFSVEPWVDGRRFQRSEGAATAVAIGRYINATATPPMTESEAIDAMDRLGQMLYWNTREVLGNQTADATRGMLEEVRGSITACAVPCYGDGRMAPHEFLRDRDGHIYKTDHYGHDRDHTAIGRQCLLWDAAGAIVEWNMNEAEQEALLSSLCARVSSAVLDFYRAAYAAFRIGVLSMVRNSREQQRVRNDMNHYQCWLSAMVDQGSPQLAATAS